jgi:hypothetical protein
MEKFIVINPNIVISYYEVYNQQITKVLLFIANFYFIRIPRRVLGKKKERTINRIRVGISETIRTHKKIITNNLLNDNTYFYTISIVASLASIARKKIPFFLHILCRLIINTRQGVASVAGDACAVPHSSLAHPDYVTLATHRSKGKEGGLPHPCFGKPSQTYLLLHAVRRLHLCQFCSERWQGRRNYSTLLVPFKEPTNNKIKNEIIKDNHNNEISLKFKQ